jgi:hypothetical protein
LSLGYGTQAGSEFLWRSSSLSLDDVNVLAPSEGIYLAMHALLDEGATSSYP